MDDKDALITELRQTIERQTLVIERLEQRVLELELAPAQRDLAGLSIGSMIPLSRR